MTGLSEKIDRLKRFFARVNPPALKQSFDTLPIDPLALFVGFRKKIVWLERVDNIAYHEKLSGKQDNGKTIAANIDEYLSTMISLANTGKVSVGHVSKARGSLDVFRGTCGNVSVEHFDGSHLAQFQKLLLANVENETWSDSYASGLATYVKMFVRWLWEQSIIQDLPRNIKKLGIKVETRQPDTLTLDEVKSLLAGATGRTKLFLLLMLNTGANQIDIASLKPSEVDWVKGRIIRKRTKTSKRNNVPVVNYKLWPETFSMLAKFGKQEGEPRNPQRKQARLWSLLRSCETDGKINGKGQRKDNHQVRL